MARDERTSSVEKTFEDSVNEAHQYYEYTTFLKTNPVITWVKICSEQDTELTKYSREGWTSS